MNHVVAVLSSLARGEGAAAVASLCEQPRHQLATYDWQEQLLSRNRARNKSPRRFITQSIVRDRPSCPCCHIEPPDVTLETVLEAVSDVRAIG